MTNVINAAKKKKVSGVSHVGLISTVDKGVGAKMFYALFAILLVIISLLCILPPVWVLLSGFKEGKEFFSIPPTIIPKHFNVKKLADTWHIFKFGGYYKNTIVLAIGSIVFKVTLAGMAGYVIALVRPKGVGIFEKILMITMMIPGNMMLATLYKNIVSLGLLNSYIPLWMMSAADTFMVLVFRSFFSGIPTALVEAASIDGSGEVQTLFKIILPMSKPVVVTAVILTINGTWSDFFWPYLIIKDKGLYTIMLQIFSLKTAESVDVVMISLIFAIIPPVLLFVIFQKFIMQGFTMSGIKG